jgi:glycosyltransferase involved in cell wall biosynthesis
MDDVGISDAPREVRKTIRVLMCGPLAVSGGVSTHTKSLNLELHNLGITTILFNTAGKDPETLNGSVLRKLYQRTCGLIFKVISHRKDYDIIHIQVSGGLPSFISAVTGVWASKLVNKKLVVTFHYSQTDIFLAKYRSLVGYVLKNASMFFVVSNKQKSIISSSFPQFSSKIVIIPNGYASTNFFPRDMRECREILDLPLDKKIILNISNIIETKGHVFLIQAVKELLQDEKDLVCLFIGKGCLRDELEILVKNLKLENYIKFLGWKEDLEIPLWINASNIFVLPSLAEGNPTVMFECLGCGKPFIGTMVGGIPEIITSEDYGRIVDPGNSASLAKSIKIALNRDWKTKKIASFAEQFTWKKIAHEVVLVYKIIQD